MSENTSPTPWKLDVPIGETSPATAAVIAAEHPSPEDGGPCATCAFRSGTEANKSEHTVTLAALCVEGGREFRCHEKPGLCHGWIAAVNAKHAVGESFSDFCGDMADVLSDAITKAAKAQAGELGGGS